MPSKCPKIVSNCSIALDSVLPFQIIFRSLTPPLNGIFYFNLLNCSPGEELGLYSETDHIIETSFEIFVKMYWFMFLFFFLVLHR